MLHRKNRVSEGGPMDYPEALQARIKIPNNLIDRDIADCHGYDVEHSDSSSYTMVRRRPVGMMFVGQPEFLASLPQSRIAEAKAAIRLEV
jgi:hypothetical protein